MSVRSVCALLLRPFFPSDIFLPKNRPTVRGEKTLVLQWHEFRYNYRCKAGRPLLAWCGTCSCCKGSPRDSSEFPGNDLATWRRNNVLPLFSFSAAPQCSPRKGERKEGGSIKLSSLLFRLNVSPFFSWTA